MRRLTFLALSLLVTVLLTAAIPGAVETDAGLVSGTAGSASEVRVFKGIPFGAPPWPVYRDRTTGRPMVADSLSSRPSETTPNAEKLALYDALYAKQPK